MTRDEGGESTPPPSNPGFRLAFVTGASAGFGAAIARKLAQHGLRVVVAARRGDRLRTLASEIGQSALPFELDVMDEKSVLTLPGTLPDGWREIDVLVNNAGLALGLGPAWEANPEDWERMVGTNVRGLMNMTRAMLPGMVARDRGHIVNLGSIAGRYAYAGGHIYGGSKAFVEQFSLNLRADLIGRNVRVTNIEPGLVGGTEFSAVRFDGDVERAAAVYRGTVPLNENDIAEAVLWVVRQPAHVNINRSEMMPTCQAPQAPAVKRAP